MFFLRIKDNNKMTAQYDDITLYKFLFTLAD